MSTLEPIQLADADSSIKHPYWTIGARDNSINPSLFCYPRAMGPSASDAGLLTTLLHHPPPGSDLSLEDYPPRRYDPMTSIQARSKALYQCTRSLSPSRSVGPGSGSEGATPFRHEDGILPGAFEQGEDQNIIPYQFRTEGTLNDLEPAWRTPKWDAIPPKSRAQSLCENDEVWEVVKIVGRRMKGSKVQYEVQWANS